MILILLKRQKITLSLRVKLFEMQWKVILYREVSSRYSFHFVTLH